MELKCELQKNHIQIIPCWLNFFLCGRQQHTGNLIFQTDFANRLAVNDIVRKIISGENHSGIQSWEEVTYAKLSFAQLISNYKIRGSRVCG